MDIGFESNTVRWQYLKQNTLMNFNPHTIDNIIPGLSRLVWQVHPAIY